jgi:hypothetical protein
MSRSRELEAERAIRVFLVGLLVAASLGALVGAGLARSIFWPPTEDRR